MKTLFLVASVIITLLSSAAYIRDILRGTTKPNIVSWLTWTLITGVATIAEFAAGEWTTGIFTLSAVIETALIVILGLKYGYAKYSRFDVVCQIGALVGFILWWLFNSPTVAIVSSVIIDFIGALPTVRHSWIAPHEETWIAFALASLGGVLALGALGSYALAGLAYPVYIVMINIVFVVIIIARGRKVMNHSNR
jgi:hypothetical protein